MRKAARQTTVRADNGDGTVSSRYLATTPTAPEYVTIDEEEMATATLSTDDLDSWCEKKGPDTPLLDTINYPVHLKNLNLQQLYQLCKELRADIVFNVSKTGGHLSASLGVIELTVALHYVFNCPADRIIWDVGHQAYGHKILTGRRSRMNTIRQTGGLSGAWGLMSRTLWRRSRSSACVGMACVCSRYVQPSRS